jgi:hypothetical protein
LPANTAKSKTKPRTLSGLVRMENWRKLFIGPIDLDIVGNVKGGVQVLMVQTRLSLPKIH